MTTSRDASRAARHRLFHAMVVMGSSLAIGCGGNATGGKPDTGTGGDGGGAGEPDDGGTSGTSGAGGGSGATGGTGGAGPGGGTGGRLGTGGTGGAGGTGGIIIGTGGTGGMKPPVAPGPFECPPGQWDCSASPAICDYSFSGYLLPDECDCDEARPRNADDCNEGESFVCLDGVARSDGTPFTENVPFECACVPEQDYCEAECDLARAPTADMLMCATSTDASAPRRSVLCGCAVVVLL